MAMILSPSKTKAAQRNARPLRAVVQDIRPILSWFFGAYLTLHHKQAARTSEWPAYLQHSKSTEINQNLLLRYSSFYLASSCVMPWHSADVRSPFLRFWPSASGDHPMAFFFQLPIYPLADPVGPIVKLRITLCSAPVCLFSSPVDFHPTPRGLRHGVMNTLRRLLKVVLLSPFRGLAFGPGKHQYPRKPGHLRFYIIR